MIEVGLSSSKVERSLIILQAFFKISKMSLNEQLDIKLEDSATQENRLTFLCNLQALNKKISESALNILASQVSKHIIAIVKEKNVAQHFSTVPWMDRFWMFLSTMIGRTRSDNPGSSWKMRQRQILGLLSNVIFPHSWWEKTQLIVSCARLGAFQMQWREQPILLWRNTNLLNHLVRKTHQTSRERRRWPSFLHRQKLYTTLNTAAALIRMAPKGTTSKQVDAFLSQSETCTKFWANQNKFSRLKVQSCRINEIWSGDLANMHQLARENDGRDFYWLLSTASADFSG